MENGYALPLSPSLSLSDAQLCHMPRSLSLSSLCRSLSRSLMHSYARPMSLCVPLDIKLCEDMYIYTIERERERERRERVEIGGHTCAS